MRDDSRKPLRILTNTDLEVGSTFFDGYDFPKRPKWSYAMSKDQLDRNENRYFTVNNNFLLAVAVLCS